MKVKIAIIAALSLLLAPLAVFGQSEQKATTPPPVAASLVREGDFAMELAGALKLGTPQNEAEAETLLVTSGISPKNGWISNYPVTPDVIAEIQQSVIAAADGKRLPVAKEEALAALKETETSFEMAVIPGGSGPLAGGQAPTTSQYMDSNAINDYYNQDGPPVVTYYPPPWDYDYLYAWVPDPFWYDNFYFPGFFILTDFDIFIGGHGHHHHGHWGGVVSNHVVNSANHTVARIDPVTRTARAVGPASAASRGFTSSGERRAATSIQEHSMNRWAGSHFAASNRGQGNFGSSGGGAFNGARPSSRALSSPSFSGGSTGRGFSGGFHGPGPSAGFHSSGGSGGGSSFGGSHGGGGSFGGGGFHGGGGGGFSGGGGFHGGGFGGGHGGGGHR